MKPRHETHIKKRGEHEKRLKKENPISYNMVPLETVVEFCVYSSTTYTVIMAWTKELFQNSTYKENREWVMII